MTGRYEELHTRSISDPEGFWGDAASEIDWIKPWDSVRQLQPAFLPLVQGRRAEYGL